MAGRKTLVRTAVLAGVLILTSGPATAQTALPSVSLNFGKAGTPGDVAVTIQILVLLTILTLAPSILMMMTSFTRIVVVLHFVKQALGAQGTPPNQVVIGLSLFLTMFIMQKPAVEIYNRAWIPYEKQECTIQEAFAVSQEPLREFMLRQTREKDLALFVKMADLEQPATPADLPLTVVVPGFIISELRIAFQIGFMIYLPFLIIDMVVASVLVSMGMMMLPPVMISLPFKVLMFVLVDGWYLVVDSLVRGIR
ncbi:MAG TPA: flagellar biosynthesis protein FliP [Bacteroidetes bacterium]|nr:flagellar biosynthesis protein FliP [Bacteroidota bacterium]